MRIGLALLLLTGLASAQPANTQARQQDLNFVSAQVPKLHPDFFFQLNPADFTMAVSSLQGQISTLTDAQFYVGLARLVAMAGDAHTTLNLDDAAAANAGFQTFPLTFTWLDDGIFVTAAAADYSKALGTRLIAVAGTPIDQAVSTLGTVIPHENSQWLHFRVQQYLRGQQILQGLGLLPQGSSSPLTFQDLAGHQFTLQVTPGNQPKVSAPDPSLGPLPLPFYRNGRNYWYLYSAPFRLLYFQYAVCENDTSNPFPVFAADLLQTIDSSPVDTLVIDLRNNTGGNSEVINPLLTGLSQRLPSLLANPVFRAFVFINKGTFSSGMDNAMTIKSMALQAAAQYPDLPTRLIVAGESTGGKPAHYGNVTAFTLPGSQLAGQYSRQFFTVPPGIPDGPAFDPDLTVPLRSTDYFARSDSVARESMARWNGVTSAPTGSAIVLNGASFRVEQGLAPGSIASAFGAFGQTPDQILIAGVAAQILGATAAQVNLVVPSSLTPGMATVSVRTGGMELASGNVTVTATGPGLFVLQSTDPSQPGAIENQDYSVNSQANPAAVGSVLQIFATGYGPLDSTGAAPVTVLLGATAAEVLYSGPVAQYPGLWQINARVPNTFTGQLPIQLIADNAASNAVTVWVH